MADSNIALIFSRANKYLKTRFVDNDFRDAQMYGESPLYHDIYSQSKSGLKPGENIVYPIKVSRTNHVSANFSTSQSGAKKRTGVRDRFTIPFDADYHDVARVSSKAIGASKEQMGAFVDLLDDEVMDVCESVVGAIGGGLFRQKTWQLGETADGGGILDKTEKTVQLSPNSSILEIEGEMEVDVYSSSDLTTKLASVIIERVNRETGVITLDSVSSLTEDANSKNVFYYVGTDSTTGEITTISEFLVGAQNITESNKILHGVDRSVDPVRLGGVFYEAKANDTITEALQKGIVKCFRYYRGFSTKIPKKVDKIYVNPVVHQLLVDELDDKVRYNKSSSNTNGDQREAGFSDVGIYAGGRYIPVVSDPNQLIGQAFGLNLKTWSLNWIGSGSKQKGPVHLFSCPEGGYLKTAHDGAGVEARVQAYPTLGCFAPGLNVRWDLNKIAKIATYLDGA